jgi:hypothetical protein
VASICTTSFNIKFLHFASIVILSFLYASHAKELTVALPSILREVFLMETERALSDERIESFKHNGS